MRALSTADIPKPKRADVIKLTALRALLKIRFDKEEVDHIMAAAHALADYTANP